MKFGSAHRYTHRLYTKPVIIFLLILTLFLARSVYERFVIERDMAHRRAEAEAELSHIQERKKQMEKRVKYLEGERGIEEEIRKNFDVAREGEQVIILIGEEATPEEVPVEVPQKKYPWYIFWR